MQFGIGDDVFAPDQCRMLRTTARGGGKDFRKAFIPDQIRTARAAQHRWTGYRAAVSIVVEFFVDKSQAIRTPFQIPQKRLAVRAMTDVDDGLKVTPPPLKMFERRRVRCYHSGDDRIG